MHFSRISPQQKRVESLRFEGKEVVVSRDVRFFETQLPYTLAGEKLHLENDETKDNRVEEITHEDRGSDEWRSIDESDEVEQNVVEPEVTDQREETIDEGEIGPQHEVLGRGARQKSAPYWSKDYSCLSTRIIKPLPCDTHLSQSSPEQSGTRYPLVNYVSTNCFSRGHKAFLAAIDATRELQHYFEAAPNPKWQEAMRKELDALEKNGTWKVMTLPQGKKPIGCKWVYKIKHKADRTIERYKARLVAQGST